MSGDKRTLLRDALRLVQAGKIDKAVEAYKAAVKIDPRDATIHNTLGDLHAKRGRKKESIAEYLEASQIYEKDGLGLRAVAICQKAVNVDPGLMDVRLKLADLYAAQKLTAEARAEYLKVADHHDKRGDLTAALDIFRRIADLEPANLQVRVKLAGMFEKQKFPQKAAEEYVRAAAGHREAGDDGAAAELLARALKLSPENAGARTRLAELHAQRQDWPVVVDLLGPLAAQGRAEERLVLLYAEACLRVDRPRDAARALEAALAREPESAPLHLALGRACLGAGDTERGLLALGRGVDAQLAAGRQQEALAGLREMSAAVPADETVLRRIIEIVPDDEAAAEGLRRLEALKGEPPPGVEAEPPELPGTPEPAEPLETAETEEVAAPAAPPPVPSPEIDDEEELILVVEEDEIPEAGPVPGPAPDAPGEMDGPGSDHARDSYAETETGPEPTDEQGPDPGVVSEPEAGAEPGPEPETDLGLEPDPGPEPALEADPELEALVASALEPGPESGDGSRVAAEAEPSPVTEPEAQPLPAAPSEAAREIEPEPACEEFDLEAFTESAAEPAAREGAATDIFGDLSREFDTRPLLPEPAPHPQLDAGLSEIFQEFQRSVKEQLGDEDFETHYNLGIAYKEMGLVDEALAEFALAERSPGRRLDAISMAALCLREGGRLDEAAVKLRTGAALAADGGEEQKGFLYDLAALHEQGGRPAEAREALQRLAAIDPGYRDVAARLEVAAPPPESGGGRARKKPRVSYL